MDHPVKLFLILVNLWIILRYKYVLGSYAKEFGHIDLPKNILDKIAGYVWTGIILALSPLAVLGVIAKDGFMMDTSQESTRLFIVLQLFTMGKCLYYLGKMKGFDDGRESHKYNRQREANENI